MPKGNIKIVGAAFVTGNGCAPFALDGKRVLVTMLRQDEEQYIVIFNDRATAHHAHGEPDDEDAVDSYVVASARWHKGGRAVVHVIEDGMAYTHAVTRATAAAYDNEG